MSVKKSLKIIALTAAAQDHHNAIKIRSILKWLKTGHEVRIQINGKSDRQKAMESLFKRLESDSRSGARVIQKVVKPESIKFYLRPTQDAANIVIDDQQEDSLEDSVEDFVSGKDVFSDEFESELKQSIDESIKKSRGK